MRLQVHAPGSALRTAHVQYDAVGYAVAGFAEPGVFIGADGLPALAGEAGLVGMESSMMLRAVVGTSLHLVTRGMHRLSICAAAPCGAVVVDVTRNGRQRYCSVRCANRAAVRRHRSKVVPGRA